MNRCDFCGAPLDPEEKKCPYCGTSVPKTEKTKPAADPVRRPPPGTTSEPPLWSADPYQPAPAPRSKAKRGSGCLIAFVIAFILIVFFSVIRSFTDGAFSVLDQILEGDTTVSYSFSADVSPDTLPEQYSDWYQPGMYKVGVDLAAGVYRADALEGDGYFAVCSDSSGKSESILFNDMFETYTYLVLQEGQYLKLSRCVALESEKVPAEQPQDGVFTNGVFRVGIDIPAGEYKITGNSDDSYYRLMGSAQCAYDDREYIASDYVEITVYLTLEDGQFLTLEGGAQLPVENRMLFR